MVRQGRQRTCQGCGGRLSRYNPGHCCRACVVGSDERPSGVVAGDSGVHPLRWARRRRGMSLDTLAGLVGLSASFLCRIEHGERELHRKSHVLALAEVLRVTPAELMPWVGAGTPAAQLVPAPSRAVSAVRTGQGLCAAETTGDLLDCDCGYLTHNMKVQILEVWDAHAAHTRDRGHADHH